jgi:hypothetical protein
LKKQILKNAQESLISEEQKIIGQKQLKYQQGLLKTMLLKS